MAIKTYVSKAHSLSMSLTMDGGKVEPVRFVNGEFSTDKEHVQEHIEDSDRFKRGDISIKPSALESAKAKAKDLRAAADKAVKAAEEAEAAVKALEAKPAK